MTVGGITADIILVRVDDPASGKIWLVSQGTIASVPKLYALLESEAPTAADRIRLTALSDPQLLGMSSAQWLGWLLSIPISWLLAWLLTFLLSAQTSLEQTTKASLPYSLGDTSWNAAQVHDCHPAA